jgi:hypothetical protein
MPLDQSDPISQDPKVQGFLEETLLTDEGKYRILQELRRIVLGASKQISERMMYGGIMFSFGEDFGGIFASKSTCLLNSAWVTSWMIPRNTWKGPASFAATSKFAVWRISPAKTSRASSSKPWRASKVDYRIFCPNHPEQDDPAHQALRLHPTFPRPLDLPWGAGGAGGDPGGERHPGGPGRGGLGVHTSGNPRPRGISGPGPLPLPGPLVWGGRPAGSGSGRLGLVQLRCRSGPSFGF